MSFRLIANYLVTIFVLLISTAIAGNTKTFPNIFELGSQQESVEQLEKAISHVFDNLYFPNDTQPISKTLKEIASSIDKNASIMFGGGTIRSCIGFIYQEELNSKYSTLYESILSQQKFSYAEIQGIGSDWDIYIDSSEKNFSKISKKLKEELQKLEISSKISRTEYPEAIRKQLYPIPDIKHYESQISMSIIQGGSEIDWLAYSINSKKIIEPESNKGILERLVEGHYNYVTPQKLNTDSDKQLIRAFRALSEIPYLNIKSSEYLNKQLTNLLAKLERGDSLSEKAIDAFDKLVRNSRFAAADNRFLKVRKQLSGSFLSDISSIHEKQTGVKLLPEFLPLKSITLDNTSEEIMKNLSKHFISYLEFSEKYTNNGTLYHYTPDIMNILKILRNGFYLSNDAQGASAQGSGLYSTANLSFSDEFRIPFQIKNIPDIKILDAHSLFQDKSLMKKLNNQEKDLNKVLREKYGVNIIIHTHLLIQSSDVVDLNKTSLYNSLIQNKLESIHSHDKSPVQKLAAFESYQKLIVISENLSLEAKKILPSDFIKKIDVSPALSEFHKWQKEIIKSLFTRDLKKQNMIMNELSQSHWFSTLNASQYSEIISIFDRVYLDKKVSNPKLQQILWEALLIGSDWHDFSSFDFIISLLKNNFIATYTDNIEKIPPHGPGKFYKSLFTNIPKILDETSIKLYLHEKLFGMMHALKALSEQNKTVNHKLSNYIASKLFDYNNFFIGYLKDDPLITNWVDLLTSISYTQQGKHANMLALNSLLRLTELTSVSNKAEAYIRSMLSPDSSLEIDDKLTIIKLLPIVEYDEQWKRALSPYLKMSEKDISNQFYDKKSFESQSLALKEFKSFISEHLKPEKSCNHLYNTNNI